MSEKCKGCGIELQNEDSTALGYTPRLDGGYCQRCWKLRHYGDVVVSMRQGIPPESVLDKINDLDGTVFWICDLFNLESSLISRLNQKLPGKDIVLVLTKRDVLPATLSDDKIRQYVFSRLKEEGISVQDILISGYLNSEGRKSQHCIEDMALAVDEWRNGGNVIFMGAANTGKSTLINRLLARDDLTVSRHPGTTLDVVEIPAEGFVIYDTPGLENTGSILTWLPDKDLKTVIPTKPLKPFVCQIFEDQSLAAGGLARLDVVCKGKASIVGYFSLSLPIHRGKLADADRLWKEHLGKMLSPALDGDPDEMTTYHAPKLQPGEKMDIVIHGLGWFSVSGDISSMSVKVHKGIKVSFRKALI